MALMYSRFPARVQFADGSEVNRSAVVVIDGLAELAVLQQGGPFESGSVAVIATLTGVEVEQGIRYQAKLTGDDGTVWEVSEGDGCGCRSPLRDFFRKRLQGQPLGT